MVDTLYLITIKDFQHAKLNVKKNNLKIPGTLSIFLPIEPCRRYATTRSGNSAGRKKHV